jgi:MATE family multidrug resistance protein
MAHLGISQAATIRVGNAYGRKSKSEMLDRSIAAGTIGVAWSLMTSTMFVIFGAELIALFLAQDEPARGDIITYGVVLLYVAALFQLVDGAQVVAMGVLRGIHDTAVPMLITFVSYWIIGLIGSYTFAFVFGWNGVGLWFGLVLGLGSAAIALATRFIILYRRLDDEDQSTNPAQNAEIRSHA